MVNGKPCLIKRDICLPYWFPPCIEDKYKHEMFNPTLAAWPLSKVLRSTQFYRFLSGTSEHTKEMYQSAGLGW